MNQELPPIIRPRKFYEKVTLLVALLLAIACGAATLAGTLWLMWTLDRYAASL